MAAKVNPSAIWSLRSEHSGAFLRLRRMLEGRRSFTLCFLTYTDSVYRDRVSDFLEEQLSARVRVAIDPSTRIGTEALFETLGAEPASGPAQLVGLEHWPDGIDDLLKRLNYRRGALAEHCARPLLVWIPSQHLRHLATGAADLWAWRSGVFDFDLPADMDRRVSLPSPVDRSVAAAPRRLERIAELRQYLAGVPRWRPIDVDLAIELGDLRRSLGEMEEAEAVYRNAKTELSRLDDRRRIAIAAGRIADILQARGELDEALRIRTEEQLPVFQRLGDVRSRAITLGQVADILQARGELDEALRIRTEEELPVYERLGDVRSRAITLGKVADILQARGELDEALRIRTEEELPVYERLGDVRSRAITLGKVADILQARGELDEALRIRTEEGRRTARLRTERLGDVRSRAITLGQVADILQARGELDEALRIRTEEELPVFEQLGDVRSRAITLGKVADILQARGELDEALRIRTEEQLPVFERLGDVRERAITLGKVADILQARGELDEALRIRTEEELPVYERLGDCTSHHRGTARGRALAGHHPGQGRRYPPGTRGARRSTSHPHRGRIARLRTARGRALAGHHPGQGRRYPPGTRGARRSTSHPHRGRIARLRTARGRLAGGGRRYPPGTRSTHFASAPNRTARGRARAGHHPRSPISSRHAGSSTKHFECTSMMCCRLSTPSAFRRISSRRSVGSNPCVHRNVFPPGRHDRWQPEPWPADPQEAGAGAPGPFVGTSIE